MRDFKKPMNVIDYLRKTDIFSDLGSESLNGLDHCPAPRCIMHFSNSLADTDAKGPGDAAIYAGKGPGRGCQ